METMEIEVAESWDESPIDACFRLRHQAVMIEARAAERLAEVDRDGLFVDGGCPSAMILREAPLRSPTRVYSAPTRRYRWRSHRSQ